MKDHRPRFLAALLAQKQAQGKSLSQQDYLDVCHLTAEILIAEAVKEAKKERKKSGIDERSRDVLNVYPRREGGDAALVSITKAIQKDGFEVVLEKTSEYASAVARWAPNRKRSQSGSSLIPLPTTFFNNRRYLDDAKAWWEGTGGKKTVEAPIEAPSGWLPWLTTELSLISEDHPAHGQLLYCLNSRTFHSMPASWQARCNAQLKQIG